MYSILLELGHLHKTQHLNLSVSFISLWIFLDGSSLVLSLEVTRSREVSRLIHYQLMPLRVLHADSQFWRSLPEVDGPVELHDYLLRSTLAPRLQYVIEPLTEAVSTPCLSSMAPLKDDYIGSLSVHHIH